MVNWQPDCIASYHLSYLTCGVARVNEKLHRLTGLPVVHFSKVLDDQKPLLSLKFNEFSSSDIEALGAWSEKFKGSFDTFVHGFDGYSHEVMILKNARRNIACNSEVAQIMRQTNCHNILVSSCPCSNLADCDNPVEATFNIMSFGMAHKFIVKRYEQLKLALIKNEIDYRVNFSTAVHDGFDLDESFLVTEKTVNEIFGNRGVFLGILSDNVLIQYLKNVDVFATFFTHGYRENNTSVNTAFEQGKCVITNIDELSPSWMVHGDTFLDIDKIGDVDFSKEFIADVAKRGLNAYRKNINWEKVILQIGVQPLA